MHTFTLISRPRSPLMALRGLDYIESTQSTHINLFSISNSLYNFLCHCDSSEREQNTIKKGEDKNGQKS